ncbi:hypothetical protein EDD22DRAFT_942174, partial [Suillus occidentalis]
MAHPVLWRGKTFFYPIGIHLQFASHRIFVQLKKADILLLGCGDPRHILYTVYTKQHWLTRMRHKFGNIFFHFYLDKASHDLLISQCRKLVQLSRSLDSWNNGPYGHFLHMCTGDTLAELRRLWQLYVKTTTCSPSEAKAFQSAYAADVKASKAKVGPVCTAGRAAGPLSMYALKIAGNHYNIYWETGICSAVPKRPSEVSYPNATLAYSMVGDKFAVHYGTDPLACFHLAEAFAPAVGSARHPEKVTLEDVISVCKTQFSRWCTSVSKVLRSQGPSSPSPFIIRCFVGDALSLCQALDYSHITKSTSTPFPLAPWKTACITLDPSAYGTGTQSPAPTMFNVIDTSNLLDHVGVLNILVRTPSATLYTEGLFGTSPGDTLPHQLCGDFAIIGLLLGLIPVSFVSQFTNRSNMYELFAQATDGNPNQNHERLSWKLLGSMVKHSGIVHYHRRSFRRMITDWDSTMNMLHDKIRNDRTLLTGINFYQDLCCQMHLLGIFTVELDEVYGSRFEWPIVFRDWKTFPQTVCVVLVIPRVRIQPLLPALDEAGTPCVATVWNLPSRGVVLTPSFVCFEQDSAVGRFRLAIHLTMNAGVGAFPYSSVLRRRGMQISGRSYEAPGPVTNSALTPTVDQVSMHSIAIALGDKSLQSHFLLPIDAKKARFRIARKSFYIEVTLPLKLALGETDADMFPVIPKGGDLALWNMHRVNLDQCVPFSIANRKALDWVNPHIYLMLSDRERRIPHGLMTGSTLLDVKYTIHSMFRHASGTASDQTPSIFAMLYITDLRLDVGSHAIVADAWVMPSSPSSAKVKAFNKVSGHVMFGSNMKQLGMGAEERKAWVHLLVAATERCRTWEHKTNCEYR